MSLLSLAYLFLGVGSLTESEAHQSAWVDLTVSFRSLSVSVLPSTGVTCMLPHCLLTWVLGSQAGVLVLAGQSLSMPLLQPFIFDFILCRKLS